MLPLGQGTFTHNTAGVPIIVACTKADLIDDNTDLVGAGASGMGGMVKGKGGEWEERTTGSCSYRVKFSQNVRLTSYSSSFVSRSHSVADGAGLFTRHRSRRHATSCAHTRSISYLFPLPPTARSIVLQRQCGTHSHSFTSRIRPTATASSYPRDGIVRERSRVLRDGFDAESAGRGIGT